MENKKRAARGKTARITQTNDTTWRETPLVTKILIVIAMLVMFIGACVEVAL